MATLVVKLDASSSQKDLDSLVKSFEKLDKSSQKAIKSATASMKMLQKSTDLAVSGVKSLVASAASLSLTLAADFYDTNVELERFEVLMEGVTGSMERGQAAMDYVLDFATKAPFSIDALSDTFVRFTVAGLKPMQGSMESLTDAVAAFGGTPEDVKLATMALQQMSAKGVVSMEELRRQLSERIPTAIHDMAEGLGLSYSELVDKISSGNQMAGEAIEELFEVWDTKYSGAGEKLMDTMKGAVIRFGVEWTRLLKDIGDGNGSFSSLTSVVTAAAEGLSAFRNSAEGARIIDEISDKIVQAVEKLSDPAQAQAFFTAVIDGANTALAPITKMYDALMWIASSSDQILGPLSSSDLKNVGVDTSDIDSSNYASVRNTLLEIQELYDNMSNKDITTLMLGDFENLKELTTELDEKLKSGKMDIDTADALKEMQTLVDKANKQISMDVTADTGPAEKAIEQLKEEVKRTPLEVANDETFNAMKQFENSIGSIKEKYRELSEELAEKNGKILEGQLDLASELRDISRSGLTDKSAWLDVNNEIQSFIAKAAEASKAGDTAQQVDYLERAKSLVKSLPEDGINMEVTQASLDSFKRVLDYQDRITRGGKVDDGGKLDDYTAKYKEMSAAIKTGEMEVVSGIEARNKKYELTKQIGEELLDIQKQDADLLEKNKDSQSDRYDELKKAMESAAAKTELVKVAAEDVGLAWVQVGDTWMTTTNEMVSENGKLIDSIKNAITEMEYLQGMSYTTDGSGKATTLTPSKGSELGSRITAGDTHLVGERGMELFTANKDGWIIPNHDLKKSSSSGSIDINLGIQGSDPVQLQGTPGNIDRLISTLKEKEIYSS